MTEILQADNLKLSDVKHGFFTRAWGDCGLYPEAKLPILLENRRQVAKHLSVQPENLLSCYQDTTPNVITVTKNWTVADRPRFDAMVTVEKNIALGILTADCVPVLFADAGAGVVGAAHAGWRGALTGILENTIDAMQKLGANKKS